VQDVEDLPPLFHAAAGSGVLGDVGDGAQDGGSVVSLQSAATDDHDRALGGRQDLEAEDGNISRERKK